MILNYQTQIQILDEWCWAAVTSSVSFNYDTNSAWLQSRIVGKLIDSSCENITTVNAAGAPLVCHTVFSLADALQLTNNFAWMVERHLTLNEIRYQINNGWPVCCQIHWAGIDQAHFITIYGYEGNTIIIGDPQAGVCSQDYNALINDYRSGNWIRSYGTQPSI